MGPSFISVDRFAAEHPGVLGYPRATPRQLRARAAELGRLGVTSVSLSGPTSLGGSSVLGKGYVGVVVLARRGRGRVAVKIRRTDSPRDGMRGEAGMLGLANAAGVGPGLVGSSRNFLVMEHVEGVRISAWAARLSGAGSARRLRGVIRGVLEDCRRLDAAGIDHGELSNISKHVIVGGSGQALIDFDGASARRRPSNVTSAAQAILIGSGLARDVARTYRAPPRDEIIAALRAYKQDMTDASFAGLLGVLKV